MLSKQADDRLRLLTTWLAGLEQRLCTRSLLLSWPVSCLGVIVANKGGSASVETACPHHFYGAFIGGTVSRIGNFYATANLLKQAVMIESSPRLDFMLHQNS